jgi:hypothetical protein
MRPASRAKRAGTVLLTVTSVLIVRLGGGTAGPGTAHRRGCDSRLCRVDLPAVHPLGLVGGAFALAARPADIPGAADGDDTVLPEALALEAGMAKRTNRVIAGVERCPQR